MRLSTAENTEAINELVDNRESELINSKRKRGKSTFDGKRGHKEKVDARSTILPGEVQNKIAKNGQ